MTASVDSGDIPQANDPVRVLRLVAHLASTSGEDLPAEFRHPRDRLFYMGAVRALGLVGPDDGPTERLVALAASADPRAGFAAALAVSPVGSAWLSWAGVRSAMDLDPESAADFLIACSALSESTAHRRASTLKRWVEWCQEAPEQPVDAPNEPEPPPVAQAASSAAPSPAPTTPSPSPRADPNRLIAGLARSRAHLNLDTVDLCFLAALYLRGDRGALASFEDDALVDVFERVCDLVAASADSPRRRATSTIQRLRDDRLLQRVDGAGLVRSGEYTLTGLAAGIVDFYLRDEALTKESLVLLTRMLHLNLGEVRAKARKARGDEWNTEVVAPLNVTVRDLVDGIRRRQRGLDAQQQEVQDQIGILLDEKWSEAIDSCQHLLDTTSATLSELNEVLLRDTHLFVTALQEIQHLASEAGHSGAEEAAQGVMEQVDVIASWGSGRQRAWSAYYQYVHRFLQEVVRLDPDRALSQRLRDLVTGYAQRPFACHVADAPSIRRMRPIEPKAGRARVSREHEERETDLPDVDPDDARAWLEERVLTALANGIDTLAEVTAFVLAEVPESEHAVTAGRIAALIAEYSYIAPLREATWRPVTPTLEIGDWTLDGVREDP